MARDVTLPALIDRASQALLGARTSAEILEARDIASTAYSIAKTASRIAKAKNAHDRLIAAAHRAQADALEIEAGAKRRLADEYDSAQERGEVGRRGDFGGVSLRGELTPTAADIGLTKKDIHEARQLRDAEERDPGITRRTLEREISEGREPTKAALRRALVEDDDDDDDEIEEVTPAQKRDAFLIFANEAMLLAKYDGPINKRVIEAARATAAAWCRLVDNMEHGK